MKPMYKMLFRRFIFIAVLFAAFGAAASAQESPGFFAKVKSFFTKEETPATVSAPVAAPAESEKTEPKAPVDRYAPTFNFEARTIGNDDAPLKMYVFTSFTCGHCAYFHNQTMPEIARKYADDGRMQIIVADFPLDERAMVATMISKCLEDDNSYFAFMDTLYENQNKWMMSHNLQEALLPYARLSGMPEKKMLACAQDESALKEIARQRNLYIMKYKINATPTLVLKTKKRTEKFTGVPAMEEFDATVADMLKDVPPAPKKAEASAP
ncbi:MAG: thioredoxin domain-containing protein [Alphaproteobacteria bacterium]|jgi:protein-disulfide isomerase